MRLRLGFELDASLVQPRGEATLDLDFAVANGQAIVTVRDLNLTSSSSLFDFAGKVLSKPLGDWLAQKLGEAINEAIADLPQHEARLKKVEIIDIQP